MVIDVNGIEMQWTVTGEGEPLLWLHGCSGPARTGRYIFDEPPAGFSVIAPDLRGHGASTNPSGEFTFRQCAPGRPGAAASPEPDPSQGHRLERRGDHAAAHGHGAAGFDRVDGSS